jgi:hypothetical protein
MPRLRELGVHRVASRHANPPRLVLPAELSGLERLRVAGHCGVHWLCVVPACLVALTCIQFVECVRVPSVARAAGVRVLRLSRCNPHPSNAGEWLGMPRLEHVHLCKSSFGSAAADAEALETLELRDGLRGGLPRMVVTCVRMESAEDDEEPFGERACESHLDRAYGSVGCAEGTWGGDGGWIRT